MPRTIEEGFQDFLKKLTPRDTETAAAQRHRASIQECLQTNFGLKHFFRSGSFGNGTSIAGYSDVDYFACVPPESLDRDSLKSLRKFRYRLARRFPGTRTRVQSPVLHIPFGLQGRESTEVVPAYHIEQHGKLRVYGIPDGCGGWIKSCPDAHREFIKSIDAKLGGKARPLIRFLKAWKFQNKVPITSFYLELRIAKLLQTQDSIVYSRDIVNMLSWLLENDLPSLRDPLGVSGYINACANIEKERLAKRGLKMAVVTARRANLAEVLGKPRAAFLWWNRLFKGMFPSY